MTPEQQAHLDSLIATQNRALTLKVLLDLGIQVGCQPEDVAGLRALAQNTVRDANAHAAALVGGGE